MGMKYNPKTGEFENDFQPKVNRTEDTHQAPSFQHTSTYTPVNRGCLGVLLIALVEIIPLVIIGGLVSMCS